MKAYTTVPQYQRIADTLRGRIFEGLYKVGECIPPNTALEKMFEVSNITVRKAIDMLAGEGLIEGRRGRGTIVKKATNPRKVTVKISGNFADWISSASAQGFDIDQKVISSGIQSGLPRICEQLGLKHYAPVWGMKRVRWLEEEPISYHINYADAEFDNVIDPGELDGGGSFVDKLAAHYKEQLFRLDQNVEATVANLEIARLLGVEFGAPIFFVEVKYISKSGKVLALTHLYLRADRYTYNASILI